MALDNELKSKIVNDASRSERGGMEPVQDFVGSHPVSASSMVDNQVENTPIFPNITPIVQENTQETQSSMESLLKSIEKQFISLNQSVADLEYEVKNCQNPDYRDVFLRIDSAKCSIEKILLHFNDAVNLPNFSELVERITAMESLISVVAEKQDKNDRQLTQTLRENANFQIQVRQGMQKDIESLKEQQSGEQFNPILKEIASIYVEYQSLLEDESISDLSRKNLKALFEQMEDLLTDFDAEITRSEIGSVRQTRSTKIIGKILTAEQDKHNTIAMSRKPGVLRGRTVLYPEFVDVYVYDPSMISEVVADTVDIEEKQDNVLADKEISNHERSTNPSDEKVIVEGFETAKVETSKSSEVDEITAENAETN